MAPLDVIFNPAFLASSESGTTPMETIIISVSTSSPDLSFMTFFPPELFIWIISLFKYRAIFLLFISPCINDAISKSSGAIT